MVKLRKRIEEAKQVGTLYHVCRPSSALYNLKYNKLEPGKYSDFINNKSTISFTRNKRYIVDTVSSMPIVFQLALDGDAISDHNKIQPFASAGYRDSDKLEQEEVALERLDNLSKYLKGVIVYVLENQKSIDLSEERYFEELKRTIEALRIAQEITSSIDIKVVRSWSSLAPSPSSTVPKDVNKFIALLQKVIHYSAQSTGEAIRNIGQKIYASSPNGFINTSGSYMDKKLFLTFDPPSPIKDEGDVIKVLVETIQEQLNTNSLVLTEEKPGKEISKRHDTSKLNTILRNRTYKIANVRVFSFYDWVSNTMPLISLDIELRNNSIKTFYILFP